MRPCQPVSLAAPSGSVLFKMESEMMFGSYDELPQQLEFHQRLRQQVERGREMLEVALANASKIPVPGDIPNFTEEQRIQQIREVLERREASRVEAKNIRVLTVRLTETPTFILFQLEPLGSAFNTKDAEIIQNRNDAFLSRKNLERSGFWRMDYFTQTLPAQFYKEKLQTDPIEKKDVEITASTWLLYDAFNEDIEESALEEDRSTQKVNGYFTKGALKYFVDKLNKATLITSRVLASNSYAHEQMLSCQNMKTSRDISYKIERLWVFTDGDIRLPVNKICLNPLNPKVIGVGYGDRQGAGAVGVWGIKNPEGAERTVRMDSAVTDLQFSSSRPRLLAFSTISGGLYLADISSSPPFVTPLNLFQQLTAIIKLVDVPEDVDHLLLNQSTCAPCRDPLWSILWLKLADQRERLLSIGQSGILHIYDPIHNRHKPKEVCRLKESWSKRREEAGAEEEPVAKGPLLRLPQAGLSLAPHPADPAAVYVTTPAGLILQVRLEKDDEETEAKIEAGSPQTQGISGLRHSPYLSQLYLTYSGNGVVTLWLGGITQPLLTLTTGLASLVGLVGCEWSPSHSTVLASLCSGELCLWDLSRRVDLPVASLPGQHFTTLAFSPEGNNILVGCKDGSVLVYKLSDMPHRPYMQKEHLEKALNKSLKRKPELLKNFNAHLKRGELSYICR